MFQTLKVCGLSGLGDPVLEILAAKLGTILANLSDIVDIAAYFGTMLDATIRDFEQSHGSTSVTRASRHSQPASYLDSRNQEWRPLAHDPDRTGVVYIVGGRFVGLRMTNSL